MAQMPDIKAEVNREPEKEKKKGGGLLGRLFGGGSGGGAMGGGAGGFGSAAAGGGLMATKAGMLALVLVGTTVAGGIGMAGYRLFGPGSDQSGDMGNLQLFAPKPKQDAAAGGQAAPGDGSSESLSALAKANHTPAEPAAAPAETPKDASAAGAAADPNAAKAAAATAGKADGALNAMGNTGSGASKLLKNSGAFKGFTMGSGGGGGSGASASVAKTGGAATDMSAAKNGASGALRKGTGAAASGGGRAITGRRASKAMGQAFSAMKDGRGATSSYGAGRTFDGSAASNAGAIGPDAGAPGIGGPGESAGQQPKSMPNTAANTNEFKAPPTPTPTDAAPWQNAINTARALIGVATLLLLAAQMINKAQTPWTMVVVRILGGLVAAIGAVVAGLGVQIATGQYGQKLQGGILGAAGAGLMLAGAMVAFSSQSNTNADGDTVNADGSVTDAQSGDPVTNQDVEGGTAGDTETSNVDNDVAHSSNNALGKGGIMDANPFVLIGGGIGLVGLAGSMMAPMQKYPSKTFNDNNGNPPDTHWFGYQEAPSETALKKMIA